MKNLAITVMFILAIVACKKAKDDGGTGVEFSCRVNGQQWKPTTSSGIGDENARIKILGDTSFDISGQNEASRIHLSVTLKNGQLVRASSYPLNDNRSLTNFAIYDDELLSSNRYATDSSHTGIIEITSLDKSRKWVEGTFSFQAYHPVLNQTVQVTEGRFAMNFDVN